MDKQLDRMFTGSKMTARFIVRSGGILKTKESDYEKDCKEFGKLKVDDFADELIFVCSK